MYSKILKTGLFKNENSEPPLPEHTHQYDTNKMIWGKACDKVQNNPSDWDIFIRSNRKCYHKITILFAGLSYKMMVILFETS